MQYNEAKVLRESWGNKVCSHPHLEKKYYLGADTMDFVCTACGKEFTRDEKENLEANRAETSS